MKKLIVFLIVSIFSFVLFSQTTSDNIPPISEKQKKIMIEKVRDIINKINKIDDPNFKWNIVGYFINKDNTNIVKIQFKSKTNDKLLISIFTKKVRKILKKYKVIYFEFKYYPDIFTVQGYLPCARGSTMRNGF